MRADCQPMPRFDGNQHQESQNVQVKGNVDKGVTQLLVIVVLCDSLRYSDDIIFHPARSLRNRPSASVSRSKVWGNRTVRGTEGLVPIQQ